MSARKVSDVWTYFKVDADPRKVVCNMCSAEVSRGGVGRSASTSGMLNHLKNKHVEEYNQTTNSINKTTAAKKTVQPTLSSVIENIKPWDINEAKAKQVHFLIGEMMALDNEALSMVERQGFQNLMAKIVPRYKMPSRNYFAEKILPEINKKVVVEIKKDISVAKYMAFTSDMWTSSCNNISFLSFTAHWINNDFKFNHAALNMKRFHGQHTGENISQVLKEMCDQWEIPNTKIHAIVHDNARNMMKAARDANIESVSCFIHTLQLVVIDSIKVQPEILEMLTVARKIVTHFNHSGTAQEELTTIQKELNIKTQKLVQDICTRWNSSFYMMLRLLEQKRAISVYLIDSNIPNLTANQWDILEQLLKLLQPFEEITKITSSGLSCISEIIPHIVTLKSYCTKKSVAESTLKVSIARTSILQGLNRRFENINCNKKYLLSTLLDPRYKTKFFKNNVQIETSKQLLLEEIEIGEAVSLIDGQLPHAEEKRSVRDDNHSSFWECYNEILSDSEETATTNSKNCTFEAELNKYLKQRCIPRQESAHEWWSKNKLKFPCLATLALKYLCSPSSSVYSERLFSEAGNIYEEKRANLLPERAESLVFLHHNLPLVNVSY